MPKPPSPMKKALLNENIKPRIAEIKIMKSRAYNNLEPNTLTSSNTSLKLKDSFKLPYLASLHTATLSNNPDI